MKEILEMIILNLVDNKDAVTIKELVTEKSIILTVNASENDIGKIIGKQGRVAKSIRTVMSSIANKENKKIVIEFLN